MLTPDEVRQVLTVAMGYDNRNPGQVNVAVWGEAARRGRWTLDEAVDAVHAHYATETAWLMPGHVTARIRTARQDRALAFVSAGPRAIDPGGQTRVRALVAGALPAVPDGKAPAVVAPGPDPRLARACPYCQAQPDQPCTRVGRAGRVPLAAIHPARQEAP